jgi:hypothetical protein
MDTIFLSFFDDVQPKDVFVDKHASPAATGIGIFVCKKLKTNVKVIWAYLKMYK